jgi:PKHD-type hydroxylase
MFKVFEKFVSEADCEVLRKVAATGEFQGGESTVRGDLRSVKQNQEYSGNRQEVDRIFRNAIASCKDFQDFVMPRAAKPPILSRYSKGMTYGRHLDAPLMFANNMTVRSDMSMTVFINKPEAYDGGELTLETDYGIHQVKLPAGDAVVYDTQTYHWVAEVTRGERLGLVTWFQSLVNDPAQRRTLYELRQAFNDIAPNQPEAESTRKLQKVLNNLTRLWSQP